LLNRSLPPSTVVIATDLEGGIYNKFALRYQEISPATAYDLSSWRPMARSRT
jgi:hypothetical protein